MSSDSKAKMDHAVGLIYDIGHAKSHREAVIAEDALRRHILDILSDNCLLELDLKVACERIASLQKELNAKRPCTESTDKISLETK